MIHNYNKKKFLDKKFFLNFSFQNMDSNGRKIIVVDNGTGVMEFFQIYFAKRIGLISKKKFI